MSFPVSPAWGFFLGAWLGAAAACFAFGVVLVARGLLPGLASQGAKLLRGWKRRGAGGRGPGGSAAPGPAAAPQARLDLSQGHISTEHGECSDDGASRVVELVVWDPVACLEWRAVVPFDGADGLPGWVSFWSRPGGADEWSPCGVAVPGWLVIQAGHLAKQVF